jgi:hypothetical protein
MEGEHGLVEESNIGRIGDGVIHTLKGLDRLTLPDNAIKFDENAIMSCIKEQSLWNRLYKYRGVWVTYPTCIIPTEEQHGMIEYLFNNIGNYANSTRNLKHVPPCRRWTVRCATCTKIAPCGEHTGPPCLAITSDKNEEQTGWENILIVAEYDFGPVVATRNAIIKRLTRSAESIFEHQPTRSYVLCAAMCNSDMAMVVLGRRGACTSDWFEIHSSPERFIRNLVGLMTVEREFLGFDPNRDHTRVDAPPAKTGPQESQKDGYSPEISMAAAADVEALVIDADVEIGDDSEPAGVFELTNPPSSGPVLSNPNHENEAVCDLNASKKRKRSGNSQERESPPSKKAASDKEHATDENVSDLNVNDIGQPLF